MCPLLHSAVHLEVALAHEVVFVGGGIVFGEFHLEAARVIAHRFGLVKEIYRYGAFRIGHTALADGTQLDETADRIGEGERHKHQAEVLAFRAASGHQFQRGGTLSRRGGLLEDGLCAAAVHGQVVGRGPTYGFIAVPVFKVQVGGVVLGVHCHCKQGKERHE